MKVAGKIIGVDQTASDLFFIIMFFKQSKLFFILLTICFRVPVSKIQFIFYL